MASKGRMGIQENHPEFLSVVIEFQWPAKAGWGFRGSERHDIELNPV